MLLSEMFGVERDVDFKVIGYIGYFMIREWSDGTERIWWRLKDHQVYANADLKVLYDVIFNAPANIIHLPPPLTDEQREQLKAIWTLGGRWLAKDCDGKVFCYFEMPHNNGGYWHDGDVQVNDGFGLELLCSLSVCEIPSKSDPEPYDIGKALGVGK